MKRLKDLHKQFMEEQEFSAKLRPATLRGYIAAYDLLELIFPGIDTDMVTSKILTEFFKRLEKRERVVGKGRIVKGVKPSTIATYRSKLGKFFDWLVMKQYLEKNPFAEMEYPHVIYGDRKFLKKENMEAIFNAVGFSMPWANNFLRKRNLAIFSVLLFCGLRRGELLGLQLRDVDMQRKQLTVRGETSKSKVDRIIPLNTQALRVLEDYLAERNRREYKTHHLFVSNNVDKGLTENGLKHLLKKIIKFVGFKFHLHQFRHTFAVNLFNANTNPVKIKALLGHKDIRMTMTYLRCIPQKSMRGDVECLTLDNLL